MTTWQLLHPDERKTWVCGKGAPRSAPSLRERLAEHITEGAPDDCWPWSGKHDGKGYGRMNIDGQRRLVSRVVFFLEHGYWPTICRHTCDNPPCCNPAHLIDGTHADNAQDRVERGRDASKRKTHCPAGHPYSGPGSNVQFTKQGHRKCGVCNSIRSNRHYHEKVKQR